MLFLRIWEGVTTESPWRYALLISDAKKLERPMNYIGER